MKHSLLFLIIFLFSIFTSQAQDPMAERLNTLEVEIRVIREKLREPDLLTKILYSPATGPVISALIAFVGILLVNSMFTRRIEETKSELAKRVSEQSALFAIKLESHKTLNEKLLELYTCGIRSVGSFKRILNLDEPVESVYLVDSYSEALSHFAKYYDFQDTNLISSPIEVIEYIRAINSKFAECFLAISKSPETRKSRRTEIKQSLEDIENHLNGLKNYADGVIQAAATNS